MDKKSTKKTVSAIDWHTDHVPGETVFFSLDKNLIIASYEFSHSLADETPKPPTERHIFGIIESGSLHGEYRINESRWKKIEAKNKEWICGQAFENSFQWRWEATMEGHEKLISTIISIDPSLIKQVALETMDIDSRYIEIPHKINFLDPVMNKTIQAIKAEMAQNNYRGKIYTQTLSQILAAHILQKYCSRDYHIPEYTKGFPRKKLHAILAYFHDNLHLDLSLDSVAKEFFMSTYHFSTLFKQSMEIPPHQYLINCKINEAKRLLSENNLTIEETSLKVGYRNQSHFAQLFKKNTGLTPSKYRESQRNT